MGADERDGDVLDLIQRLLEAERVGLKEELDRRWAADAAGSGPILGRMAELSHRLEEFDAERAAFAELLGLHGELTECRAQATAALRHLATLADRFRTLRRDLGGDALRPWLEHVDEAEPLTRALGFDPDEELDFLLEAAGRLDGRGAAAIPAGLCDDAAESSRGEGSDGGDPNVVSWRFLAPGSEDDAPPARQRPAGGRRGRGRGEA